MRRRSALQLVLIGLVAGGAAVAVALLIPWLPKPASKEAHRIDVVFWFVIGICIAIFAIVVAMIAYSVLHFRARPDDDRHIGEHWMGAVDGGDVGGGKRAGDGTTHECS